MVAVGAIAITLLAASIFSTFSAIRAGRAERRATESLVHVEKERNEKELARQQAIENERAAEAAQADAEQGRNEALWNLYVARQFPIVEAWDQGNFGHLEEMLDDLRPAEGSPDFRGWEWTYFRDQCDQAYFTIKGSFVAWHPQKNEFAVLVLQKGPDSALELWNGNDPSWSRLRTLAVVPTSIGQAITGLRWSADGDRLAYATYRGLAVVLEVATGKTLFSSHVYPGGTWPDRNIRSFDLSHDGRTLAVSNWIGRIDLWDVDSAKLVRVLHDPKGPSNLASIAFNSDSTQLAAALRFGRRTTWNVRTGEAFEYAPQSLSNGWVAWNQSGTRFVATDANSLAVYELNRVEPLNTLPHRTPRPVRWIGDERIVSSGYDHVIRIWDAESYELLSEQSFHRMPVTDLAVSSDKKFLATSAYADNSEAPTVSAPSHEKIKIVALEKPARKAIRLAPEVLIEGQRHFIAWDDQGRFLASGHLENHGGLKFVGKVRVWDGDREILVREQSLRIFRSLAWRPDQQAVWVTELNGGKFLELDLNENSFATLGGYALEESGGASFSPDGHWLTLTDKNSVKLIDVRSLKVFSTLDLDVELVAWCMRWSNDSQRLAIGNWDQLVIWDPFDAKSPPKAKNIDHHVRISSLTWSPDDGALALGRLDGQIQFIDVGSLETITSLHGHAGDVHGIDWAPNGRRLASSGGDGAVKIWDAATGHELVRFDHPEKLPFFAAAWSRDSRRLAAGDSHANVFIWGSSGIQPVPQTARGLSTGVIARQLARELFLEENSSDEIQNSGLQNENARTWLSIASTAGELEQWDAAVAAYAKAIELDPYTWDYICEQLRAKHRLPEAEKLLRQAVVAFEKRAADSPSEHKHQRDIASVLNRLGWVLRISQPQEAEQLHRQAIAILEKLVGSAPTDLTLHESLGFSYRFLVFQLDPKTKAQEREQVLREAAAQLEQTLAGAPDRQYCRFVLVDTYRCLADDLVSQQRTAEAEESYRKALQVVGSLTAGPLVDTPDEWPRRQAVDRCFTNLIQLLTAAEAEQVQQQAITLYERLALERPDKPYFRKMLTNHQAALEKLKEK
jgi:WD40 repeat protein